MEVYGHHVWNQEDVQQRIRDLGVLILVEGPNDCIILKTMSVDVFANCSNVITAEHVAKVVSKEENIGVPIGVMFDNDPEGDNGARQSISLLAEHGR